MFVVFYQLIVGGGEGAGNSESIVKGVWIFWIISIPREKQGRWGGGECCDPVSCTKLQLQCIHVYHSGLKHSFPIFGTTYPLFLFHIQTTTADKHKN